MTQHIKNVVLVHGAFADGSGWKRVADILKNDGYKVSVAQPPETSYAEAKSTPRRPSTPWAARSFWSATAMAGPSSPRLAITQTLKRLSILPPLPSMKVKAVRRSNRPCRKPPRHSNRTATNFGGLTRRISPPTSPQTFHGMKRSSWLYRRCRSPPTRSPTRLRIPPGSTSPPGTWSPAQTGQSIQTRSA